MNSNRRLLLVVAALVIAVFAIGCGGESKEEKQANEQAAQAEQQAKMAKKQARQEANQARQQANQLKNLSAEEKKQAAAAAQAQAGEQSAETDAANAEAAAAAAAADKKGNSDSSGGGNANAGGGKSCGGGIQANSVTSCAFARNVVAAWKRNESATVTAHSPDTGETYKMSCSGSQMLTTCTGGAGARVTFTP